MELGMEIVDLRTKQNVLDYMNDYDVEIQVIEEEDGYEEERYVPYQDTGLSKKEIVDMLFDAKEQSKYIRHRWYTDFGSIREMFLKVGKISYFEYSECYREPEYPYVYDTTRENVYAILLKTKNETENLMRLYFDEIE